MAQSGVIINAPDLFIYAVLTPWIVSMNLSTIHRPPIRSHLSPESGNHSSDGKIDETLVSVSILLCPGKRLF